MVILCDCGATLEPDKDGKAVCDCGAVYEVKATAPKPKPERAVWWYGVVLIVILISCLWIVTTCSRLTLAF